MAEQQFWKSVAGCSAHVAAQLGADPAESLKSSMRVRAGQAESYAWANKLRGAKEHLEAALSGLTQIAAVVPEEEAAAARSALARLMERVEKLARPSDLPEQLRDRDGHGQSKPLGELVAKGAAAGAREWVERLRWEGVSHAKVDRSVLGAASVALGYEIAPQSATEWKGLCERWWQRYRDAQPGKKRSALAVARGDVWNKISSVDRSAAQARYAELLKQKRKAAAWLLLADFGLASMPTKKSRGAED